MDVIKELTECLVLQKEIDAKTIELRRRYRDVIESEKTRGNDRTIVVKIDGQMYSLEREDEAKRGYRDAMDTAHKLKGFWMYRLFKIGKILE